MRQLFIDKGIIAIKNVAEPLLDDYSIMVQVHYSCISAGTEQASLAAANHRVFANVPEKIKKVLQSIAQHGLTATTALIKEKLHGSIYSLGYSCSGQVIAVGKKVISLQLGDYVACAGAGYAHHADIVCIPELLATRVIDPQNLAIASSTTLGAIALQGIRRASIGIGDTVCVIGLGLLGQLTVQLAKQTGAVVFGIDIVEDRLIMAQKCGSDRTYDGKHFDEILPEIAFATNHHGADVTIIAAASSSNDIVCQAIALTRKKGKVVLVGDVGLDLQRDLLYKKEIDFLISCSYGPGRYDPSYEYYGNDYPYAYVRWTENRNMQAVMQLIESKKLNIPALLPTVTSLVYAHEAYQKIQNKEILGAILSYRDDERERRLPKEHGHVQEEADRKKSLSSLDIPQFIPAKKIFPLRVGVVGAGGFARLKLLPLLSQIKQAKIEAIVDVNSAQALSVARTYQAAHVLSDDHDLFTEDKVDVVVIASPHLFHAQQALRALRHGKAVFLEKPMVTTQDQLDDFKTLFERVEHPLLCVDYNRSFSPFMAIVKKAIYKRTSPLMISYRMNAGYIPAKHWVQTEIGAGRIIGEACHIFDLFSFLVESEPLSVSVEAIHGAKDALFPTDNFSVQIRYRDGSIGNLFYTAMGHARAGKERMEIFFDGKTIVMDDYKIVQGHGMGSFFDKKVTNQDKGHDALLKTFFSAIQQSPFTPPIPFKRLIETAQLSLLVDALACQGGGSQDVVTS